MSGLGEAIRTLDDQRRELERSWESTRGPWRDARREEFDVSTMSPLIRAAANLAREMEAVASEVQQALAAM